MNDEDSLHDQLSQAYLDYFKASEKWEQKHTVRTYYKVQRTLCSIASLTKLRRAEIRKIHLAESERKGHVRR